MDSRYISPLSAPAAAVYAPCCCSDDDEEVCWRCRSKMIEVMTSRYQSPQLEI